MALLGKIQEFEPGNESMSAYLERVELFMAANAIDSRGAKGYSVLKHGWTENVWSFEEFGSTEQTTR